MIDLFDGYNHGGQRLHMPARPYLSAAVWLDADALLSLMISRVWSSNRRRLCWVLYRPAEDDDTTVQRITAWSYRAGYGGFVAGALYPLQTETRAAVELWRRDAETDVTGPLQAAAQALGEHCRKLRVSTIVLATGDLDEAACTDLTVWLATFRAAAPKRLRWVAIGRTLAGWPMAPAISGRSRPPKRIEFAPWEFPAAPKPPFFVKQGRRKANEKIPRIV